MKKFWKSYKREFLSRNISGPKRILKVILIISVPFLYSMMCVFAFWNPISNVGNGSMLVVNEDQKVLLYQYDNITSSDYQLGIVEKSDGNLITMNDLSKNNLTYADLVKEGSTYKLLTPSIVESKDGVDFDNNKSVNLTDVSRESSFNHWQWVSAWDIFKNILTTKDVDKSDDKAVWNLSFNQGDLEYNFNNIHYVDATTTKKYDTKNYKTILTLTSGTTSHLLGMLSSVNSLKNISNDNMGSAIKLVLNSISSIDKVNLEAKYSGGFIYGYYLNSVLKFSTAVSKSLLPTFIGNLQKSIMYSQLSYTPDEDMSVNSLSGKSTKLKAEQEYVISDYVDSSNKLTADDTLFGDIGSMQNSSTDVTPGGKIYNFVSSLFNFQSTDLYKNLELFGWAPEAYSLDDFNGDDSNISIGSFGHDLGIIIDGYFYDTTHGIDPSTDTNFKFRSQLISQLPINISLADANKIISLLPSKIQNLINRCTGTLLAKGNIFVNDAALTTLLYSSKMSNALAASGLPDLSTIVTQLIYDFNIELAHVANIQIGGSTYDYYGLGIGLFFVVVGIFVGIFIQTFIYDRGKRYSKANAFQWYFSKTAIMYTTAIVEVTIALLGAIIGGWSILPISILLSLYGLLLLFALVVVLLIQFLWFVIPDETVGRFSVVLVLIFNLATCGGIFPSFMEWKVFSFLSNISIFKYAIRGETLLIFNISENGWTTKIGMELLTNILLLLCVGLIISLVSLFAAKRRNRTILFGTTRSKIVSQVIEEKKLNYNFKTTKKELLISKINLKISNLENRINENNLNEEMVQTIEFLTREFDKETDQIKKDKINKKIESLKSKEIKKINEKYIESINKKIEQLKFRQEAISEVSSKAYEKSVYNYYALPNIRDNQIYWGSIQKIKDKKFKWFNNSYREEVLKTNYTKYDEVDESKQEDAK